MKEESLLTGPLEPTNEGYALAKITGLRLAQYYASQYGLRCLNPIPCNLYGPGDTFDLDRSHVLSALVRRFVDARDAGKEVVTLWGTGTARREFLHVEDLVEALLFLVAHYDSPETINVGAGVDVSIRELAELISGIVGYQGGIEWDPTMPDGMPRKCLDVTRLHGLGYHHRIGLREGVGQVVEEYTQLKKSGRIK
jgi:GDP-L-fucose synthase